MSATVSEQNPKRRLFVLLPLMIITGLEALKCRRFSAHTAWPRRSTTPRSVCRKACLFSGFDSAVCASQ